MTRRRRRESAATYRRRRLMFGGALALVGVIAFAATLAVDRYLNDDDGLQGPAPQTLKKTMWSPGDLTYNDKPLLPIFRDLGVGIVAVQAHWDTIAPDRRPANPTDPKDPAYLWPAYLDLTVSEPRKYGMQTMIQIIGAPPWANGGRTWEWTPENLSDFDDFATAIAKRYPSVHLWMIWGEPNRQPNFQPLTPAHDPEGPLNEAEQVAPHLYSQMLDGTYEAFKAVSEKNLVIGGNTYTSAGMDDINPYQWIENMTLPDGSRPRMDMWGHNPYGFHKPDLDDPPSRNGTVAFADLERLTEALDKAFPGPPLKLYLTEWGVPIGFEDVDLTYSLNREEGIEWMEAGLGIARDWDRVFSIGWVHLIDTPYSSQGLLNKRGNRKPGYDVYKAN